jgi:transcriptional repressor NrdR
VIKRDGERCTFVVEKLKAGMLRALEKRPVETADIEAAFNRILRRLRTFSEKEISSADIGECVMNELRALDQVAYVRFASVYRSFQDINAFHEEIQKLQCEKHET